MVAPSFANYRKVSKPYWDNKKGNYMITVENPSTGNQREVRWYNDSAYAKSYGNKLVDTEKANPNLKEEAGFSKGPILAVRHIKYEDEAWLVAAGAKYAAGIGWYFPSTGTLPQGEPSNLTFLLLSFDEFTADDCEHQKKPTELNKILSEKAQNGEWIRFS